MPELSPSQEDRQYVIGIIMAKIKEIALANLASEEYEAAQGVFADDESSSIEEMYTYQFPASLLHTHCYDVAEKYDPAGNVLVNFCPPTAQGELGEYEVNIACGNDSAFEEFFFSFSQEEDSQLAIEPIRYNLRLHPFFVNERPPLATADGPIKRRPLSNDEAAWFDEFLSTEITEEELTDILRILEVFALNLDEGLRPSN